ncbi:MAG: prepilin-type N-terminal cleavage/methylation domain-containing protein [Gammaproteobacteria bacterium]
MSPNLATGRYSGFTLIEVITTIVVLAIAAAALLGVFTGSIRGSADPMIQQQAVSIAEAYMEEILLKAFIDPDGIGGETRPNYDDVQDYNTLPDTLVRDQNGNAIATLSAYSISVTVSGDSLNGIAAADSLRIDISVDHPAIDPILLSGYRTNY